MEKQTARILVRTAIVVVPVVSVFLLIRRENVESRPTPDESGGSTAFLFLPGVRQPEAVPAIAAAVEEDAKVIGVSVKGHHRAYCMATMAKLERHVVNDLIQRVPVTITYFPRANCVRALTQDDESDEPLIVVGRGWQNGKMMIRVAGQTLPQDAESIPGLKDLEVETTTWKDWKTAHPDTDIYVGPLAVAGDTSD
jgi:hypothetical protein